MIPVELSPDPDMLPTQGEEGPPSFQVPNKHTFFDDQGLPLADVDLSEKFGTTPELANRRYNRIRLDDLDQEEIALKEEVLKDAAKEAKRTYRELESRFVSIVPIAEPPYD